MDDYGDPLARLAALGGLALGLFNLWYTWRRDRVRLRVVGSLRPTIDVETQRESLTERYQVLRVYNDSRFPVTICGFHLQARRGFRAVMQPLQKTFTDCQYRIEAHGWREIPVYPVEVQEWWAHRPDAHRVVVRAVVFPSSGAAGYSGDLFEQILIVAG